MNLLKTAVKAKIPLIAVHSDDIRHLPRVVSAICKRQVTLVRWVAKTAIVAKLSSFMTHDTVGIMEYKDIDWKESMVWLEAAGSTLIVVNPPETHALMLDVGKVEVPVAIIKEVVAELSDDPACAAALSGLSLSNMYRIAALATAEYGEFTPKSIRCVRRAMFPVIRGLEEIDSDQLFYEAPEYLIEWFKIDGKLFTPNTHPLLTPRGFLFQGQPGTGKTSGAKYLAKRLKAPLYKLDLGMILGRYVGESDERLIAALRQADSFEPCVLLIDEVEKLFEIGNSSDVIPRLLGHMLWWLQEHTSKVLVVMTTNDPKKIPPELYRAGRVDSVVEFQGLTHDRVEGFVAELAKKLEPIASVPAGNLKALVQRLKAEHVELGQGCKRINQALVTEQVLGLVKRQVIKLGEQK
jgi:hypothetical protein